MGIRPPLLDRLAVWRPAPGANGAEQMALDEAMLRLANEPVMRVYRWRQPEVTFGYPQRWVEAAAFASGRPVTRRCTGGGFVEHSGDWTVALVLPAGHPLADRPPAALYRAIHAGILAALGGASLRLAEAEDASAGPACFAHPAAGDVLDGDRKIAGGALRRSREGVLYQGSVEREGDFAGGIAAEITEWAPPDGWEALVQELSRDRYGSTAWNQRR